jgi:hypothetical protein
MKKFIFTSFLGLLIFTATEAQKSEAQKNVFIRVYDARYTKMGKGNLLFSSDSTIEIIRHGKVNTFSVKQIFYIKTKRSAGHSVLMGTGIGTGVGLAVITFGVVIVSGGGGVNNGGLHQTRLRNFGIFAAPFSMHASIGALMAIFKKFEKFEIAGNMEQWKIVQRQLLNIH